MISLFCFLMPSWISQLYTFANFILVTFLISNFIEWDIKASIIRILCISLFISKKFPKAFVQQEGKEELKLSIKNSSRLESRWQLIQITRYPWNRRYTYRNRKESVAFESLLSKWKSIWALTKALDTHVTIHKENCSLSASFNPTSFSIQRVFRSLVEDPISVSGARFCSLFLQVIVP